jgi:hypothetical protein
MFTRSMLIALLLAALCASVALAWPGGPPARVDLRGPGLPGTLAFTDPALLDGLGAEQLIDFDSRVLNQHVTAACYELVRYYRYENGNWWKLDRLNYCPGKDNTRGVIYYAAGLGYSPAYNAGQWFSPTAAGEAALQRLIASAHTSFARAGAWLPLLRALGAAR